MNPAPRAPKTPSAPQRPWRLWLLAVPAGFACLTFGPVLAQTELNGAMLDYHDRLRGARDALVFADLETFKGRIVALAGDAPSLELFPKAQRAHAQRVRRVAKRASKAKSLEEAGRHLATIAQQCGGCHKKAKLGPDFPRAIPPSEAEAFDEHMERHRWALERLWEGLTAGRSETWKAGASQLGEPALGDPQLPAWARTKRGRAAAKELHRLGVRSLKTRQPNERARLLARVVTTCGRCHGQRNTPSK